MTDCYSYKDCGSPNLACLVYNVNRFPEPNKQNKFEKKLVKEFKEEEADLESGLMFGECIDEKYCETD